MITLKNIFFTLKKLSLLGLLILIGASSAAFGMIQAPDDNNLAREIKKLYDHITTYKIVGADRCPYLIGFHYYQAKPIKLHDGYLSVIDKDLWVYSLSNPTKVHYGHIFYKGKLVKQKKTFFPSSMSEEDLKKILTLIVTGTKDEYKIASEPITTYISSIDAFLTIKSNQKNKITSIFPDLDWTSLEWSVDSIVLKSIQRKQISPNGLESVLIKAAEQGNIEAVQHILGCGAQINTKINYRDENWEGEDTALIAAVRNGHTATVRFLLNQAAIVDYKDSESRTALSWAVFNWINWREATKNVGIVKLLLVYGADVNLQCDYDGNTALRDAVNSALISGRLNILKLLLNVGVNVNHKNNDGDTALASAIALGLPSELWKHNVPAVIRLLLKYGADLTITNKEGKTAYDIARQLNLDSDIIKLLLVPKSWYGCSIS